MRYLRQLLGGALVAVVLSFTGSPAHAAGEIATRVSVTPLDALIVGTEASLVVTLVQEDGVAVVDEPIALTIDGASRPRRWTDAAGVATFDLPRDLLPGEHEVVATYAGRTNAYLGATARTVVEIVQYELAIETVPSLPGMVFEINGSRFEAGPDGVARVGLDRLGDHTLTALPSAYRYPGKRVEFSRWSNETFGPTINIRAPLVGLQAGFDVSYQASLDFEDVQGNAVDEERIEEVTLRNSIGAEVKLTDGRSRWFKAVRTIRRPTGLDTVPIRYTVEGVIVDGANVVNVGQQRFDVEPDDSWPVELLLYSVRLVPNDALFGFSLGEAVILTYPSGSTARIEAVDGEFAADGLARGLYRVQVADAPGWSPVTPVALSRDQEVRLRVITYVDMAVVVLVGMGIALGLLHLGRPHLALAAMAGAKGAVGVARNPRTIGALLARPRAPTAPATEMSPAVATPGEFVLPPVRAERSSPVPPEAHFAAPPQPTPLRGAVPIAQVIRTTLGSPLPTSRAEASALPPPPPVLTAVPAANERPSLAQPPPPVIAPSMPIAASSAVVAAGTAPPAAALAAATGEASFPSVSTGDERRMSKKVPRKGGRALELSSGLAITPGDVTTQKRRRSPRAVPEVAIAPDSVTQPHEAKPRRAQANRKRTSASTKVAAGSLKSSDEHVIAASAPPSRSESASMDLRTLGTPKKRSGATTAATARKPKPRSATKAAATARSPKPRTANSVASLPDVTASGELNVGVPDAEAVRDTSPKPKRPEHTGIGPTAAEASTEERPSAARRPAEKAARLPKVTAIGTADGGQPDAAAGDTPPPSAPPEQSISRLVATGESSAGRRSKPRPAKKAASPPKLTAVVTADGGLPDNPVVDAAPPSPHPEQSSGAFAATPQRAATKQPRKPHSSATATARSEPPKRSSKKAAPGPRQPKRSTTRAVTLPEVTATVTGGGALPDAEVADLLPPTPSEQKSSASTATVEPTDAVGAVDRSSAAGGPPPEPVSPASPTNAAERVFDGGDSRIGQPQAEQQPAKQAKGIWSVARVMPRMSALSDRLATRQVAAVQDCAGCRAALTPGARFCRRCGRVTAIGEREREGLS